VTTDIKSALKASQEMLDVVRQAARDADKADPLSFACVQFQNVLTQLAEKVTQLDYRIEHLEERTGHRTMREHLNRKDDPS